MKVFVTQTFLSPSSFIFLSLPLIYIQWKGALKLVLESFELNYCFSFQLNNRRKYWGPTLDNLGNEHRKFLQYQNSLFAPGSFFRPVQISVLKLFILFAVGNLLDVNVHPIIVFRLFLLKNLKRFVENLIHSQIWNFIVFGEVTSVVFILVTCEMIIHLTSASPCTFTTF